MKTKQVFTEQERKDMGRTTLDVVLEAIDSGDKEKAKALVKRMHQESLTIHDSYAKTKAATLSHIYRTYGADGLERALRDTYQNFFGAIVDRFNELDFRDKVEMMVNMNRGHLHPIIVEEDDEKVTLTMNPCGGGQRLVTNGAYEPPLSFAKVEESHPITFGKKQFPIYCTHECAFDLLAIEHAGYPPFVVYPGETVGKDACKVCLYKNPDNIPEEIYARVGKKKPEGQPSESDLP